MPIGRRIGREFERLTYVIAGLPIAIHGDSTSTTPAAKVIRRAFSQRYWHPQSFTESIELATGVLIAPICVPLAALWFTLQNGPAIRKREGKGLVAQFIDQLRLYYSAGVVGPWYYILSLHRDGRRRAPTFLQRCETKRGLYSLLRSDDPSPLGDKLFFAQQCAAVGVRCAACELTIGPGDSSDRAALPDCDLFIKPRIGCGGKGAERWDRIGPKNWSNGERVLGERGLLDHLQSKRSAIIVQKRVRAHPALEPLSAGAVPTVRAITILNEDGRPEFVSAVFRMSIGRNRTVDNIHAGGIACSVTTNDGMLGKVSDLGASSRLGWHSKNPTTGAQIEGTKLPYWDEVRALAVAGHRAYPDRALIGWDIAIAEDGPVIIEGNRGPDMDLMQRFMDVGFCHEHRFAELIAHHLRERGYGAERLNARGASQRN